MELKSDNDQQRIQQFEERITEQRKTLHLILIFRLLFFVLAVIGFLASIRSYPVPALCLIGFTVVLFLFLLKKETRTQRKITYYYNRIRLIRNEQLLRQKAFDGFSPGSEFMDPLHDYSSDLDIFGKRSVFQLLNRTSTYSGRVLLADWLKNPLREKEEILSRQAAVKELASRKEWCEHFLAVSLERTEGAGDKEVIRDWLEEEHSFSDFAINLLGYLLPLCSVGLLLIYILGYTNSFLFQSSVYLQLGLTARNARKIKQVHDALGRKFHSIEKYKNLIEQVGEQQFETHRLKELKSMLANGGNDASAAISRLKKLVDALDARMNIIMAVILNGLLLWDLNIVRRIEAWKGKHKPDFLRWIELVAELDAFISLSLYTAHTPGLVFPEPSTETFLLETEGIGHPLIETDKLVRNNYKLIHSPHVDLLTGANMAGKSTFLRTLGVNMCLAMMGAPVNATRFRFTPLRLFTSLRTADSLQDNESFFYAELKRLRALMAYYERGEQVFFLLDEILKGTNSRDQHQGSEDLIRRILRLNGIGVVATHDVELARLKNEFPEEIRTLCFEISILDDKLVFDYTLREGVCRTMNASFLLKKMGITG